MAARKKVTSKKSRASTSRKKATGKKPAVSRKVAAKKKPSRKKAAKKTAKKTSRKKTVTKKRAASKAGKKKSAKKAARKKPASKKKATGKKKPAAKKASKKKKTTARKMSRKKTAVKKATGGKKVSRKKAVTSKKKPAKTTSKKRTSMKKASVRKTPTSKPAAPASQSKGTESRTAGSSAAAVKRVIVKDPAKRFERRPTLAKPMNPADHLPARARRRKVNNDHLIHGIPPYNPGKNEEYMNDKQLEHFRKILTAWKQDLMQEVDRTVHHMQDEASNFPDPSDRATQESEFGLELRTRDRERKLLKKIEQAIARIDDGTYGYCVETGEEIGLKRLEARPVATLSVDAQERREVAERQYRDNDDRYR